MPHRSKRQQNLLEAIAEALKVQRGVYTLRLTSPGDSYMIR